MLILLKCQVARKLMALNTRYPNLISGHCFNGSDAAPLSAFAVSPRDTARCHRARSGGAYGQCDIRHTIGPPAGVPCRAALTAGEAVADAASAGPGRI